MRNTLLARDLWSRRASNKGWSSLAAVQKGRIVVVDGNACFGSPGPRLIDGLEIIAHALHPDVHPAPISN